MGTRTRTLKYLPGHELRFGIAAVSREEATGDVDEAVCLFCRHFGREQRADKKRRSANTVKYFRDSFRPDQYTQHHQLQHATQWKKYKDGSDDDKRNFFPVGDTAAGTTITTSANGSDTGDVVLIPKAEERGRCFDLKASIVEVVAVLAVGLGPVEPTVQTRGRLLYQYMTHHNYDGEQPSKCPRWSPPPNTFESCYLARKEPPVYRVVLYSNTQMTFLMEMAAEGLSAAQISASVKTFRRHAPMVFSDLVENATKIGPTSKKSVAMAVERAGERTKEILRVDEDVSPEYNEAQTAEFVRLGVAASLSIIARLLEESWAFSLELCTVAQHSLFSYLDVRVKLYSRIGGLRSAHLLAIPKYVGKCDLMMFQTLARVLTALLPGWRGKLLGITTAGDVPFPARLVDVLKHFQVGAKGSALYRTSNCIKQLQRILNTFYASIKSGAFLQTLKRLSEYVRKEPTVLSEIKSVPGYWEQLDCEVHSSSSAPGAFGQEIDMLVLHSAFLQVHFKELALSSEAPLLVPVSWWLSLQVLKWVTARANAVFGVLQKQHVTISQQATVVASLADECTTGLHAQIHEDRNSVPQTDYCSLDKRVTLSKANLVEFVMSSSELARDLVQHGGSATVKAAAGHFATGSVNMIASLVDLSVSLQQQHAACTGDSNAGASQTTVMTDALPPVLPHELADLSSDEFVAVLEAHDAMLRGSLEDADITTIGEEHELLRHVFAEDDDLRSALEMCTQGTPFDVAWSLMNARFKSLEAFAGGLATVCPSSVIPLSDRSARDLVLCPKDMEEARLLLADFELESALHAQQLQSLTKLQEEIYDRDIGERRLRKRQKVPGTAN
ncbi:hypothetical protein PHYPSEUDO_004828 [Phytophthora pseudosyringae]|uniref:Uncharacterized protein n=1 Tax=Phytophthora pseudosyringae TaxID=221518 RepID=A0A8T1VR31_9STRA|nr:hypothetical protein PHYPSEUDO_004828 [Phytophthora pseudosyringae]